MEKEIQAIVTIIRAIAGSKYESEVTDRDLQEMLSNIMEHGTPEDREAVAAFLTWLYRWRGKV